MATLIQKVEYLVDKDENTSIGLLLPLSFGEGNKSSSKTTIEAVKQNVLNLCSTKAGERVMQPSLGLRLRRFLFEQFDEDLVSEIQATVADSLKYWLPFIIVNNVIVKMSDNLSGDFKNTMEISIHFSLAKDPTTHESVQISVTG